MTPSPYIVGVGAANADIHGRSRAAVNLKDSNPGTMRVSVGGVTRNILENAARLGLDARLVSAVGGDVFGRLILARSAAAGMDVSNVLVLPDAASSTYMTVLEPSGEMLVAVSDMSILAQLPEAYLAERAPLLRGAAAIACDPSLPEGTILRLLALAGETPVFVDPVSTAYARKLLPHVGRFHTVKPNRMELSILAELDAVEDAALKPAIARLLEKGCRRVYVTLGPEGCCYGDASGLFLRAKLRPIARMENATGAGDAFTAATIYGHVHALPPEETLNLALAAGSVAIRSAETVSPEMSIPLLRETILRDSL
ncbi:MAG: MarR family transcriptional regulator [Clostridium sp.]|nr:MarR family transcriptional regulator [Clostridium sp.]